MREIRMVEFIDSSGSDGWHPADEDDLVSADVMTVGFVLRETDRDVVLAQCVDNTHGNADHVYAIPLAAVTKQTTLRKAT